MPPIKSIDELVDEAIEESLNKTNMNTFDKADLDTLYRSEIDTFDRTDVNTLYKTELDIEDIKKRKPKPFRYLTKEESEIELIKESENVILMKELKTQVFDDKINILGLGDIGKIEEVIRRHQATKKFK